jgi:hypothetical protein
MTIASGSVTKIQAEAPMLSKEVLYDKAMEQWLDRLEKDESGGNRMRVILDVNNKYSYGCLQFQMETFIAQSKKFGIKGEMMDCNVQRTIAKAMIKNDYKAWRNWYNSVTKKAAGYPPVLE